MKAQPLPGQLSGWSSLFAVLDGFNSDSSNPFQDLVRHLWVDTGPPLTEALPRLQLGTDSVGNPSGLIHLVPAPWR